MSSIMGEKLSAIVLAITALGCAPDQFDYGAGGSTSAGGAGGVGCDKDECTPTCPEGTELTANGLCVPTCGPWQVELGFPMPAGLATTGAELLAAGTSSDDNGKPSQAVLVTAETCSGKVGSVVFPLSALGSSAQAIAESAGSVFLAGSSDGKISFAELDPKTGKLKSSATPSALAADAVIADLSAGSSGAWSVGSSESSGPWVARASGASACSANLAGATGARAVAALADSALLVIETQGKLKLARVNAVDCAPPTCACKPSFTSPELVLPGEAASARDLLVVDDVAHVVGHARIGSAEPFAFAASLSVATGAVQAVVTWDPGPGAEVFSRMTTLGSELFVGGAVGATNVEDPGAGRAALAVWQLPLTPEAKPTWTNTDFASMKATRIQGLAVMDKSVFALASTGIGNARLLGLPAPIVKP